MIELILKNELMFTLVTTTITKMTTTNYLANLIDTRYVLNGSHFSVKQAIQTAGLHCNISNSVALQRIQEKLQKLENDLYTTSTDYQELVKLHSFYKQ